MSLREHNRDLTVSVVLGILMWCYQRLLYVKKHSMPAREQSPDIGISQDQALANGGIGCFSEP